MHKLEFYTVKISDIIIETPIIKRFFLTFDSPIIFQAGQFIILKFEGLKHQFDTRSYSIADFTCSNILEICISLKDEGAATPILFEKKIVEELCSSLPQGRFVITEEAVLKPLFFICTGTGVAPFRSMIKELLLYKFFTKSINLYFGCRTREDILYFEEFKLLMKTYPNFKYFPILSREKWEGETGYVHPYYLKELENKPDALFYLCGWTTMLKETRDNLKAIGYERKDIKVEFYD